MDSASSSSGSVDVAKEQPRVAAKINPMCIDETTKTITVYEPCIRNGIVWQLQWSGYDIRLSRASQFYVGAKEVYCYRITDVQLDQLERGVPVELKEIPLFNQPGDEEFELLIVDERPQMTEKGSVRRLGLKFGSAALIVFNAELLLVLKKWRSDSAH
jgi:hypothetical protein